MATIYNSDLSKELKEGARLQQLRDVIPSQLADKVVPVMEVNPKLLRRTTFIASGRRNTSGSTSFVGTTAFSNREYYINNAWVSWNWDALSVCTALELRFLVGGANQVINLPLTNLSVYQGSYIINFTAPLKIDSNQTNAVAIVVTTTAGTYSVSFGCAGYTSDMGIA